MSLVKGRQCSESCLELLALELVRAYGRQSRVPPAAAVDAIGAFRFSCKGHTVITEWKTKHQDSCKNSSMDAVET